MTATLTAKTAASVQTYAPFTINGTYSFVPAQTDIGCTIGRSPAVVGSKETIAASSGAFSFSCPGVDTVGANTFGVSLIPLGATTSITVTAFAPPVLTPTSGGQVLDAAGNVWTLPASTMIMENGVAPAGNWAAQKLTAIAGVVYILGSNGVWFTWTNGAWASTGSASLPGAASPSGTVATVAGPVTSLTDASGAVWTIVGGVVMQNGAAAGVSAGVAAIAYVNGVVWQENGASLWWSWNGTGWAGGNGTSVSPVTGTTTVATTTTADFTIKGGKIYDPSGKLYVPKGLNCWSNEPGFIMSSGMMPNVNHIRCPVFPTNPGTASAVYPAPSSFLSVVEAATGWTLTNGVWAATKPTGIVVEFEDHNQDASYNALPAYTGAALTVQLAWVTAMATYYNGCPWVWLSGPNEPAGAWSVAGIQSVASWLGQHYTAVRAGSPTKIIQLMPGLGGGDPGTMGEGSGMNSATPAFNTMHGIIWETHAYYSNGDTSANWTTAAQYLAGSLTAVNSGLGGGWGLAACQSIQSADGVVPVIWGEWGPSSALSTGTDATDLAAQIVAQQANGNGATAWAWYPSGSNAGQWDMANNGDGNGGAISLTGWGAVAAGTM